MIHTGPMLVAGVHDEVEIAEIRRLGGLIIKVEVSPSTLRARMGERYQGRAYHAVETFLYGHTQWDYIIRNDESMKDLENNVASLVQQLRTGIY